MKDEIGHAPFLAQRGDTHESVKALQGLGAGVFEITSDDRSGTCRAVYTVRLAENVRVFGSVVRGEDRPDSDVDLLGEMADDRSIDRSATSLIWSRISKNCSHVMSMS